MNVVGIARRGIGIAGVPPIGIAVARGILIESLRHGGTLVVGAQAGGPSAELDWLERRAARLRRAPPPAGVALAVVLATGPPGAERLIARVLVAERETDLGDRLGAVVRIGIDAIELDRRDGSAPQPVVPALVGLEEARAWAREGPPQPRPGV